MKRYTPWLVGFGIVAGVTAIDNLSMRALALVAIIVIVVAGWIIVKMHPKEKGS